jgi:glycerol-3-phosphate cytidylyltransferase
VKANKTVLTYGTFDLFHVGHVRLLRRLSDLGGRVVVGCSTDAFNGVKGKACVMPYSERAEILAACRYVDEVFPEDSWGQKVDDVRRNAVDIFAMGDDWVGEFDYLKAYCEVVYLARTSGVSTTNLKVAASKSAPTP